MGEQRRLRSAFNILQFNLSFKFRSQSWRLNAADEVFGLLLPIIIMYNVHKITLHNKRDLFCIQLLPPFMKKFFFLKPDKLSITGQTFLQLELTMFKAQALFDNEGICTCSSHKTVQEAQENESKVFAPDNRSVHVVSNSKKTFCTFYYLETINNN